MPAGGPLLSVRLLRVLRVVLGYSDEEIARLNLTEADGWRQVREQLEFERPFRAKSPRLETVCFTGQPNERKQELRRLAEPRYRAVTSVSKSLKFLVLGKSPGITKLAQAREYGITLLTEAEFLDLMN